MRRSAFTLIELIVVIVIIGILSKFGVDLLIKVYENSVYSDVQNRLQERSSLALQQIANRLRYRIKDSVIARNGTGGTPIPIANSAGGGTILEWIGVDVDGWRGTITGLPDWSGFIELSNSSRSLLSTPGTQAAYNDSGALFFIGSEVNQFSNFGWNGAITDQRANMHPVTFNGTTIASSNADDFEDMDIYEFYKFAKTAYAISLEGSDLYLYYDYQPWDGDSINQAGTRSKTLLMDNVSTFEFQAVGEILKIMVCVTTATDITGEGKFALCKEKTVF